MRSAEPYLQQLLHCKVPDYHADQSGDQSAAIYKVIIDLQKCLIQHFGCHFSIQGKATSTVYCSQALTADTPTICF